MSLSKYIKYKKKYLLLKKLIGGECETVEQIKYKKDYEGLISVLESKKRCAEGTMTTNKYLIILYGPPASGKSIARKIACYLIKTFFKETLSYKEIWKTFIDTNVDELTYDLENESNKSVKDLLLDEYRRKMAGKTDQELKDEIACGDNNTVNTIADATFKIYKENRADSISETIKKMAEFLEKNIFFEIASGKSEYIKKIITDTIYYNYIPIIIYPFIDDINIIYNRSIDRGISEGRFLKKESLIKSIEDNKNNFIVLKNMIVNGDFGKKALIIKYDSSFTIDVKEQFQQYNFDELKILENIHIT